MSEAKGAHFSSVEPDSDREEDRVTSSEPASGDEEEKPEKSLRAAISRALVIAF